MRTRRRVYRRLPASRATVRPTSMPPQDETLAELIPFGPRKRLRSRRVRAAEMATVTFNRTRDHVWAAHQASVEAVPHKVLRAHVHTFASAAAYASLTCTRTDDLVVMAGVLLCVAWLSVQCVPCFAPLIQARVSNELLDALPQEPNVGVWLSQALSIAAARLHVDWRNGQDVQQVAVFLHKGALHVAATHDAHHHEQHVGCHRCPERAQRAEKARILADRERVFVALTRGDRILTEVPMQRARASGELTR